jgi:hypothetical protein
VRARLEDLDAALLEVASLKCVAVGSLTIRRMSHEHDENGRVQKIMRSAAEQLPNLLHSTVLGMLV